MNILSVLADLLTNINIEFYIIAYLLGSVPFGMIISKIILGVNITKFGSGGVGATNVYRLFSSKNHKHAKLFSILTIILDALKGLIVVLIAKFVGLSYEVQWGIALFSIIGHCYSVFLNFNGGRGVSTAIGSVFLLMPVEGIFGLIIWGIVGKVFKISSVSSLVGVLCGIIATFIFPYLFNFPQSINIIKQINSHVPVVLIGIFIIYTHLENIIRLIKGQEKKIDI